MAAVNTGEFNQKVEDMFSRIEDALDDCNADLDWDMVGGVLTIECENGSQVILNRQEPTRQIWLAPALCRHCLHRGSQKQPCLRHRNRQK